MNNTYYYHTKRNDNGRRGTFAGIVDSDSNTIKIGLSVCSAKDQFQKRIGRTISENRAEQQPITIIPLISETPVGLVFRKAATILNKEHKNKLVKLLK